MREIIHSSRPRSADCQSAVSQIANLRNARSSRGLSKTVAGHAPLQCRSARDLAVRNNVYRNVVRGPFFDLPAPDLSLAISLTFAGTTAEATTSGEHPLTVGDRVFISGAMVSGTAANAFNGVFVVSAVPAANKFQYIMASRPDSDAGGSPTMQKVLGLEKLIIESNLFELPSFRVGEPGAMGIQLDVDSAGILPPAYAFGDVLVRGNRFRYVDGQFDPAFVGFPMNIKGARTLTVRDNVVETASEFVFLNSFCGSVRYFDNRTSAGDLAPVQEPATDRFTQELDRPAEDTLVLTLLH